MEWIDLEFFKSKIYTEKILGFLRDAKHNGHSVLPDNRKILRALALTPPEEVKVVILGQDPYPSRENACGLAFSVEPDVTSLPKSLNNIFRELENDLGIHKNNGDLSSWAEQGVLLLNTTLTVYEGQANSHSGIGWEVLSTEIIKYISSDLKNVVFILWGKKAQTKEKYIDHTKHLIIKSAHPSPLSSYRGFFGSSPFSKTNKYLIKHKKNQIEW